MSIQIPTSVKKKQVCPVCFGRGVVEAGFYPEDEPMMFEYRPRPRRRYVKCRTCGGRGVI